MICEQCGKELYEYNFLLLRKYENVNDDEYLIELHDFCSTDFIYDHNSDNIDIGTGIK